MALVSPAAGEREAAPASGLFSERQGRRRHHVQTPPPASAASAGPALRRKRRVATSVRGPGSDRTHKHTRMHERARTHAHTHTLSLTNAQRRDCIRMRARVRSARMESSLRDSKGKGLEGGQRHAGIKREGRGTRRNGDGTKAKKGKVALHPGKTGRV